MTNLKLNSRRLLQVFGLLALLSLVGCGSNSDGDGDESSTAPSGPSAPINESWVKHFGAHAGSPIVGTAGDDNCSAVTTDASGNIYCAGSTTGDLGEPNAGGADAFVMKMNSTGSVLWIRQLGATTVVPGTDKSGHDFCNALALDSSGNVYCGGNTRGALGEANGGGGSSDIFVMKLDPSGNLVWLKQIGSATTIPGTNGTTTGRKNGDDTCNSIAVDSGGNVYCVGSTGGSLGEVNGGVFDAIVLKLNSSGALQWLKQVGATTSSPGSAAGIETVRRIAIGSTGDLFLAGHTTGSLAEANGSGSSSDLFFMRWNSSGALQWVKQFGSVTRAPGGSTAGDEYCHGLVLDANDNLYCAGSTSGAFAETNAGSGNADAILLKLNSSGVLQWATQIGATTHLAGSGAPSGDENCFSLALDGAGNVYCGGSTDGMLAESNGGQTDAFVLKLNASGALQWITQFGATTKASASGSNSGAEYLNGLMVDSGGHVCAVGATDGGFADTNGGSSDAIVIKLNTDGSFR